jgi:phosphoribosylaminoimidazole-succinocarboxamide synthase
MLSDEQIKQQISNTLQDTDLVTIGSKYKGKVRDNYTKDNKIIMITTDRVSAFDHVLGTIPFKGQVLNQLAVFWFEKTKDIVKNHIISVPDPNIMEVQKVKPYPVEMIVRGYIAGSLWRTYEKGDRNLYGLELEDELKKNQKFSYPIITPTTKAELGEHDEPITKQQILDQSLVNKDRYEEMEQISLQLFQHGSDIALQNGLILVDTKYEFGEDEDGNLVLMDEIHTPDSSRFWYANEYDKRFTNNKDQNQLSKEHLREWLIEQGFSGDGTPPQLSDGIKIQTAKKYIEVYEQITGQPFNANTENVLERIKDNLANAKLL